LNLELPKGFEPERSDLKATCLTVRGRLRKTWGMRVLRLAGAGEIKRLAAVIPLLAVFFLPLHFHSPVATGQIEKECSCLHGTRTLADFVPVAPIEQPVLLVQRVFSGPEQVFGFSSPVVHPTRAPPTALVS
jgi:hypothetical protein